MLVGNFVDVTDDGCYSLSRELFDVYTEERQTVVQPERMQRHFRVQQQFGNLWTWAILRVFILPFDWHENVFQRARMCPQNVHRLLFFASVCIKFANYKELH